MQIATKEYLEFWKFLVSRNPKINRVQEKLCDLSDSIRIVLVKWERSKEFLQKNPKIKEVFGLFLYNILNQPIKGFSMIKESEKELRKNLSNQYNIENISLKFDLSKAPLPTLVIKMTEVSFYKFYNIIIILFKKYIFILLYNLYMCYITSI